MSQLKGFANVVYPTKDLAASVAAWKTVLGEDPAFQGDDIAVFTGNGVEVGLSSAPPMAACWPSTRKSRWSGAPKP